MEEKGKRRFERQFQDALQSLEAQLNVGYSMENAIKEVQRDLQIMYDRHTLIVREFTYMVRQLNLNVTAEAAWKDFAARVALPEVDTFVTVFSLAKRSGGDSILIIKNAVRQLGDKAEVKREIDTVIAAKKMEFQIMSVIPLGIIGYMRLSFPEFMAGLYGNLPVFVLELTLLPGDLDARLWKSRYRNVVLYRNVFLSRSLCMDVFQEEITFQKMGQASQADIFFDVGGDKSGIFVGNRAEDRDGKL